MAERYLTFKKHAITVSRDSSRDDWYIEVRAPSGVLAYDGWWRDSANKSAADAIEEAKRGSLLTAPTNTNIEESK